MEEEHLHLHVPLVEPVAAVAPSAASNAASAPALPRGLKARGAPSSRTQMSTLVSMTVDPVRHLVERMLQSPSVHLFGENTVQYVLSRQWKDLIAIYCFRLQPLPYCSHEQDERIACSTPAAAWVQALFAVAMLLAAVALTSISIPLEEKYPKVRVLTVTLPHPTPPDPTLPHPTQRCESFQRWRGCASAGALATRAHSCSRSLGGRRRGSRGPTLPSPPSRPYSPPAYLRARLQS